MAINNMRVQFALASALGLTAFVGLPASAQTTGTISGVVHDAGGGVLPGVAVTVTNAATALTRTAVSGAEGRYVVPALPPGTYEVRAALAGFKPQVQRGIDLAVSETVAINVTLQVGDLAIEDVVIGIRPVPTWWPSTSRTTLAPEPGGPPSYSKRTTRSWRPGSIALPPRTTVRSRPTKL